MATFFFDNDISFRIVNALRELIPPGDHVLLALRDKFAVDTKDTDWIPEIGEKGWVLISCDANQRRRDNEHKALKKHGVRALYIRHSGAPKDLHIDAARIIKNWPKIRDWGTTAKPGTLVRLDSKDQIVPLSN